ncbi:hypothetical protein KUL156_48120 [Alteromonas sp. KUL156]|nr:hypothetical protein KUL154_56370 [Alteromonas sp. KUL154]GFE02220.1 hypothetical protein KUL156_48120 [Alteromonas sp. KUL156]
MNLQTALSLLKLPEDCIQEDVQKAFSNQMSNLMHVLEGVRSPEENQRIQTQIRELENAYQTALSNVPKERVHTTQESRAIPKSIVEINSAKKHQSSSASSKEISVLGSVANKLAQLISTLFAKVPQFNAKQNNITKNLARLYGRMSRKTKIIASGVLFVLAPLTIYILYERNSVGLSYVSPNVTEELKQHIEARDVKSFERKIENSNKENATGKSSTLIPKLAEHFALVEIRSLGNGHCKKKWISEPFSIEWPVPDGPNDFYFRINVGYEVSTILWQYLDYVAKAHPHFIVEIPHPLRNEEGNMDILGGAVVVTQQKKADLNDYIEAFKIYEPDQGCKIRNQKQVVRRITVNGFEHKRPKEGSTSDFRLGISAERHIELHHLLTQNTQR